MLTGAILSGGLGTRMGHEKGLVTLGGIPLVLRVARVLDNIVDQVIISVAPGMTGVYRAVLGDGLTYVEDDRPGLGPLQGMISAIGAAKEGLVLFAPCDTPFIEPRMCSLVADSAEGRDGAVPIVRGYFEPLHGCYSRAACLPAFRSALASGRRKPIDAYQGLALATVPEDALVKVDPGLSSFWSLNSPEELAAAERKLLGDH